MADDLLGKAIDLYYDKQLPAKAVALTLGISKTSVNRILKNSGYRLRSPSKAMELAWELGRTPQPYERTPSIRAKTSQNTKLQIQQKGHPFLGKHHTEETRAKLRKPKIYKGGVSPLRGRQLPDEVKAKITEAKLGHQVSNETKKKMSEAHLDKVFSIEHRQKIGKAKKLNWQNPEYRAKVVPACLKSRRPTDLEAKLIALINKYSLPYKYTGDGSFTIGRLNPDFININGKKIAIEIFGGHWHQNKKDPIRTEEGRRDIMKEYGWELIVIWGNELKSLPEDAILDKMKE